MLHCLFYLNYSLLIREMQLEGLGAEIAFFKTLQSTWMGICKTCYSRSGGGEEAFGDSYDQGRHKLCSDKFLSVDLTSSAKPKAERDC